MDLAPQHVDPDSITAQLRTQCLLAISFANDEETANRAKNYGAVRLLDKIELARNPRHTRLPAAKNEDKTTQKVVFHLSPP